jgi:hypothetical protein
MTRRSLLEDHEILAAKPNLLSHQTILAITACALIALIALLTLGPVSWRPQLVGANVDRFIGFLVLGSFLGLAQPKRFFVVCMVIILGAVFLEYSQSFMRGRHGVLHDFEFKVIGGLLGAGIARAFTGTIRIF